MARGDATEDANVANINALNAAWLKLDSKTCLSFLSDEVVAVDFTSVEPHDKKWMVETTGRRRQAGAEGPVVEGLETSSARRTSPSTRARSWLHADGDYAVHGKVRIPSKKKTITAHGVEVDQWKDGKIVRSWNWSNEMEFDMQLGIGPAAPPPPAKKKP